MSNVLIGIIGVILFIGLALAGALFLGPRFQEATSSSRASAIVQSMAQVASAANMYRAQEGTPAINGTLDTELVAKGYLKSRPNPTNGLDTYTGLGVGYVAEVSYYGLTESNAAQICAAINRQMNGSDAVPDAATPNSALVGGCIHLTAAWAGKASGTYLAFDKI